VPAGKLPERRAALRLKELDPDQAAADIRIRRRILSPEKKYGYSNNKVKSTLQQVI